MSYINDLIDAIIKGFSRTHNKLVAAGGTIIIDDTNPHTGLEANSIMAQSSTVISSCTGVDGKGNSINFKATYNWGTVAAGIPIIAPDNCKINAITLSSGSLAVYS